MSSRINDFKSGNLKFENIKNETFENFKKTYIGFMEDVLGLVEEEVQDGDKLDGVINVLIELRKKARMERNFALSDKIRDDLKALGVQLMDGKDGEMSYVIE
jgi:cysteinyl-tRNA synthetase